MFQLQFENGHRLSIKSCRGRTMRWLRRPGVRQLCCGFPPRHLEILYPWQRLARQSTEPTEMLEIQVLIDANPDDTTARFFSQSQTDLYVAISLRLKLDMPDDRSTAHDDIVAVCIEFRP